MGKTSVLNKKFEEELENALKDSIFEFRRTGLCIINKDEFSKIMNLIKKIAKIVKQNFYIMEQQ